MANTYDRGDTVRIVGTFTASGGIIFEPASVYVLLQNPLGSVGTYTYGALASSIVGPASVARAATGIYYMDLVPSTNPPQGKWPYRFDSAQGAAGEFAFNIRISAFL